MENYFNVTYKETKKETKESKIIYQNRFSNKNDDIIIHKTIYNRLYNIIDNKDILNLFIYGKESVGKYSLGKYYINQYIKNDIVNNLNNEKCEYENKEILYKRSNFHYEIIINKYNFSDFNLIIKLLDRITYNNIKINTFKNIILIKNIHLIRLNIIKLLKTYIEKNYNCNIFICISSLGIPNEFKGIFTPIRVPKPNYTELINLGKKILEEENIKYKMGQLDYIYKISNNSIVKFKNIIELSYIHNSYNKYIDIIDDKLKFLYKLIKKNNYEFIGMTRDILNDLLVDNYDYKNILKYILNNIIKDITDERRTKIINEIINCDINISKSYRIIHHLEYLFIKIINIYNVNN
jgi:hypothetical protein